jgi:hypothetical protein
VPYQRLLARSKGRATLSEPRTIQKSRRDTGLYPPNAAVIEANIQRDVAELEADYACSSDSKAENETDSTPPPQELMIPLTIRTLKRNIYHCLTNEDLVTILSARWLARLTCLSLAIKQSVS